MRGTTWVRVYDITRCWKSSSPVERRSADFEPIAVCVAYGVRRHGRQSCGSVTGFAAPDSGHCASVAPGQVQCTQTVQTASWLPTVSKVQEYIWTSSRDDAQKNAENGKIFCTLVWRSIELKSSVLRVFGVLPESKRRYRNRQSHALINWASFTLSQIHYYNFHATVDLGSMAYMTKMMLRNSKFRSIIFAMYASEHTLWHTHTHTHIHTNRHEKMAVESKAQTLTKRYS